MDLMSKLRAHKRAYFSTRARLTFVVLVALLPFAALMAYDAERDRAAAIDDARLELTSLSRMVSEDVQTLFTSAHHLLRSLAESASVRDRDYDACTKLLRALLADVKRYNNLLIADRAGNLLCSGRGPVEGVNLADREYFRRALATRDYTVGAPVFGRTSGQYSIPLVWPIVDANGVVERLVIAGMNLSWFADRFTRSLSVSEITTILWDRAGNIVYQRPNDREFGAELLQSVRATEIGKIVGMSNAPGENRLFVIATPAPLADLGLTLAFVVSSTDIEAPIIRQLWERVAILLITAAALFLLAWRVAETSLRRPIARLANASKALRGGDLSARATGPAPIGEIGDLITDFNDTAAALQSQTENLQRTNRALSMLSECNQALVRADNEQTLLDSICERVVQFGGYRFAWVGYAEHGATKLVRPVARAGHENGYLDAMTFTWADDGDGIVGAAIRSAKPVISDAIARDPRFAQKRELAAERGYASCVALPLVVDRKILGALIIYASETEAFHKAEMPLLCELAGDLAFGIDTMRTREARMRAEEQTRLLNASLERRVLERTQELEAANRAKSAFLATMSHEIRTPMNGVLGMVEVLMHERLSEHQFDQVRTIRDSATSLLGIIDDILDFSKIEAGRLDIEQQPLVLTELIEGICSSLLPVAARRAVDIALFISPQLPEVVLADEVRLRQVIYNLVGNALKFSAGRPERRGKVAVRIEPVSLAPLRISFRILDNGIGIPAEALPNLFTPFTQVEASTTRRFGGTGLGLAICKRLIDLMHGEITVDSTLGAGSTFTVTLPFEAPSEQPASTLPDLSGLSCVLLESADLDAADLAVYLEHAGARVQVVRSLEATAAAGSHSPSPAVLIQDAGRHQSLAEAKDMALAASPSTGHLLMTWGQRRRCRVEAMEVVTLDRDALRRRALLRAVLVAAGRASPETAHSSDADPAAAETATAATIADARAAGRLVLVAEDDVINQKVILRQLALLGYTAEVASTGEEALQLWRNGGYALILTDLHMPVMDGYALTEAIRTEERGSRRTPIVALTANALRGEANRARAVGMDDYLTKPVQLRSLRAAVEQYLPPVTGASAEPAQAEERPSDRPRILDVSVLKRLVGDSPGTVKSFLSDYLQSARPQADRLRAAAKGGDAASVSAITHKLKSSSRAVGASTLGDLCAELDVAGRASATTRIAALMPQFDALFAQVESEITGALSEQREAENCP